MSEKTWSFLVGIQKIQRLFLALAIPENIKQSLQHFQNKLRELFPPQSVRWLGLEQLHLTLKFLGNVETKQIDPLVENLKILLHSTAVLDLELRGFGVFSNYRAPRIIWMGVRNETALTCLQREIEATCQSLGFDQDKKPFNAHLTLGRVKNLQGVRSLEAEFLSLSEIFLKSSSKLSWYCDHLELIESRTLPSGSVYSLQQQIRWGTSFPEAN